MMTFPFVIFCLTQQYNIIQPTVVEEELGKHTTDIVNIQYIDKKKRTM